MASETGPAGEANRAPRSRPSERDPASAWRPRRRRRAAMSSGSPDRRADGDDAQRAAPRPSADVHLGARIRIRETSRGAADVQFAAFRATVDLRATSRSRSLPHRRRPVRFEHQPRRSVERIAAELSASPTPRSDGHHPRPRASTTASICRANDLTAIAGWRRPTAHHGPDPGNAEIDLPVIDAVVYGRVFATKRARQTTCAGFHAASGSRTWRIGLVHGSCSSPARPARRHRLHSPEIAASDLDYLALGHWRSALEGKATQVDVRLPGGAGADRPRPGPRRQGPPRDPRRGRRRDAQRRDRPRQVGRTTSKGRCRRRDDHPPTALVERLGLLANTDRVLDVRITGVKPDELDIDPDEVERALAARVLKIRVRDLSVPALSRSVIHRPTRSSARSSGTRDPHRRRRGGRRAADAAERGTVCRLGRLLLAGHEVTAVRVRRPDARDVGDSSRPRHRASRPA